MTIKLDQKLESELVIAIAEGLQATKYGDGFMSLREFAWADDLLPLLPQDAKSKIERYLGDRGLSRFIHAEIRRRQDLTDPYVTLKPNQTVTDFPFVSNSISFSKELIAELKKIPQRFRLTVTLPSAFGNPIEHEVQDYIELPTGIYMARGSGLPQPFKTTSSIQKLDEDLFHDWIMGDFDQRLILSNRFYFSVPLNGYAHAQSAAVISRQFEDHLRAFLGAATAVGLLNYSYETEKAKQPFIMLHDSSGEIIATELMEDELVDRPSFCSTEGFARRNQEDMWKPYQTLMLKIGTIFHDDVDCKRLFSACIWYYRAKSNKRPLDALLQATIAIEVMLGDRKASEGIGLTNLLASRCAYLLGRSSKHRAEINDSFRRIYDLRSQIVHEGRHSVRAGDSEVLNEATRLCASIINRELAVRASPAD